MATVSLTTGATSVELAASLKPYVIVPPVLNVPGGLYPLQSSAWEIDEYRIMAGWPTSPPRHEIRASTMLSVYGEHLTGRDDPAALLTGAFLRWVASDTYYDEIGRWSPCQGDPGAVWYSGPDFAPVLVDDYDYVIEDESFEMEALNFDSDTKNHMYLNLRNFLTGMAGYTVIMVMNPNSVYGNDALPYNGLWCPGRETPAGLDTFAEALEPHWNAVTIQGSYLYVSTEVDQPQQAVPVVNNLNSTRPAFLAISFTRPATTVYIASGPNNIITKTVKTGDVPVPLDYGICLGRSTGDIKHTADLALFDVGIYADVLTAEQVKTEITLLSQVYGGDK